MWILTLSCGVGFGVARSASAQDDDDDEESEDLGSASIETPSEGSVKERAGTGKQDRLVVVPAADFDSAECKRFIVAMKEQLRIQDRFHVEEAGDARAVHRVEVSCEMTFVGIRWFYRVGGKDAPKDAEFELAATVRMLVAGFDAKNISREAYKIVRMTSASLTWDGEIHTDRPMKKRKKIMQATATVGSFNSQLVGNCLPLQLLGMTRITDGRPIFAPLGQGMIRKLGDFSSEVELYIPKRSFSKTKKYDGHLLWRAIPDEKVGKTLMTHIAACRKEQPNDQNSAYVGNSSGLGRDLDSNPREFIEIRSIDQKFGIQLLNIKGTNDVAASNVIAVAFANEVHIGDYLGFEMRGLKDVKSSPYDQDLQSSAVSPFITVASGIGSVMLPFESVSIALGTGMVMDKVNLPYVGQDQAALSQTGGLPESVPVRPNKSHIVGQLGLSGNFQPILADLKIMVSPQAEKAMISTNLELNYQLTKTWLMGMDITSSSFKEAANEPGINMLAFGIHMGFRVGQ